MSASLPILLLNGPNLNALGTRQPEVYGSDTLDDVVALAESTAAAVGASVDCRQTNHEGEIIDWILAARGQVSGIVINAGGWSHTSVALRDALVVPQVPIVEVHVSNVYAREEFRQHSYISAIASGVIVGCGIAGYGYAIRRVVDLAGHQN